MAPIRKIKIVSVLLVILFSFGAAISVADLFLRNRFPVSTFAILVNVAFVVAAVGLYNLKRWAWFLMIALCAFSIVQLIYQIFTALTPQTATQAAEIASYIVAGFYLAIAFFLTGDSIRPLFRPSSSSQQNGSV